MNILVSNLFPIWFHLYYFLDGLTGNPCISFSAMNFERSKGTVILLSGFFKKIIFLSKLPPLNFCVWEGPWLILFLENPMLLSFCWLLKLVLTFAPMKSMGYWHQNTKEKAILSRCLKGNTDFYQKKSQNR